MADRATALEELIGEYREEKVVEESRLDGYCLRRAKLELAREVLLEHGETAEADRLRMEIHGLDHKIEASRETLARIDRLTALFQKSLDKIREGSKNTL
jgi:hypothetical protein